MGPLLNWVLMVSAVELSPVMQEFDSDPLHLLNAPLSLCVILCTSAAHWLRPHDWLTNHERECTAGRGQMSSNGIA